MARDRPIHTGGSRSRKTRMGSGKDVSRKPTVESSNLGRTCTGARMESRCRNVKVIARNRRNVASSIGDDQNQVYISIIRGGHSDTRQSCAVTTVRLSNTIY